MDSISISRENDFNYCLLKFTPSMIFSLILSGLAFSSTVFADDESDVLEIVHQYGDLENDLEAQAELMTADRIYITGGVRQTDEAKNMRNQIAGRRANEALNGGKTEFVTTIENPIVSIHGDTAIASFVRWWNVYPHEKAPNMSRPTWVSLVLIKENGEWLIKHTHQSPVGGS
ncbi:MAG: hypothetical protein CL926_03375 [Deltaproteobacteria bacterium]|jgi:ketosteroid isomerase-like protein|nr:hypothetical protein [Deltaproteobacteria bacterium]